MCENPSFIHLKSGKLVPVEYLDPIPDEEELPSFPATDPIPAEVIDIVVNP